MASVTSVPVSVTYKGLLIQEAFELDLIVEEKVAIRPLCEKILNPLRIRHMRTHMKHSGLKAGLLVNFYSVPLTEGIVWVRT